jgi:hypothetical protein
MPSPVKKEAPMKKEVKDEPEEMSAPEENERSWWVKEMMMADPMCHPDDPADEPGLHLLQARSFNEAGPMDERTALLWSAEESGVLVDLTKDDDARPSVKKEVMEESDAVGSGSGRG